MSNSTLGASAAEQYQQAVSVVVKNQKASTSWLQRQLRIGYNSAAQMIERMQAEGIVSAPDHVGKRDVMQASIEDEDDVDIDNEAPAIVAGESAVSTEKRSAAGDQLRLLVERVERLEDEKKGIGDDIKDVFLEAKAVGYDIKGMKAVIKIRKLSRDARMEEEAILETYKAALGIE